MATPIDPGATRHLSEEREPPPEPLGQPPRLGQPPEPISQLTPAPPLIGRGLALHAWATGLLSAANILIWAASGARDFWPIWPFLPTALALAIHGWVRLLRVRPAIWRQPHMTFALAVHAGVLLSLALFNVGIWAAGGAGSFWPIWPAIAFGLTVAIHASIVFATAPVRRELSERIDVLTSTRAGAVDAQEEKLRRIERDLHDGAQARLVALGMSLGMAEQKLATAEPEQARELLAEARVGAEQALRELRDLARGIHPPLLADRGLEEAVRSLADLSPMQVSVSMDLGARPAPAVESAAYFVSAEGLANAAKHAHAQRVEIRVARRDAVLRLEIHDDGVGGADPDGSGLQGLRRRVQALDGTFRVVSPPGGPTILTAELPCA
jgi:signal transduction histidine kinase